MVSLLLCLLDWCMAVPLSLLLEPITMPSLEDHTAHKAPLLDYIYRVGVISGSLEWSHLLPIHIHSLLNHTQLLQTDTAT